MRMWVFDGARINFDRITAFLTTCKSFKATFCIVGYGICVINFSYNFQWIIMKLCMLVMDIMKMCKWVFDEGRINLGRIKVFFGSFFAL